MNYIKYVLSKDNTKLYTKINEVEKAKANIIIVHGLAEHLDRYDEITSYLNENEFNVIRYDQRGHGRSEGKQTFYSNKDEIVEDLSAVIDKVKENYEGKKILVVTHAGVIYAFQRVLNLKVEGVNNLDIVKIKI